MIDMNKQNSLLYINSLLSFSLLFALVVLICFESSHIDIGRIRTLAQSETIKKPLTDDRTYEIIQMENDLVITLISDDTAKRSAMSMTTLLGYSNSQSRYPGMSRMLMNKLITKEVKKIVKNYAGRFTSDIKEETSNFYFELESEGFEEALKEFSNVLKSKIDFYNSSDSSKVIDDLKKVYEKEEEDANQNLLIDYLMSPNTSSYDKNIINGDFEHVDSNDIIDNMRSLYEIYYAPNNVKIALISSLSIKELKILCQKVFGSIPQRDASIPFIYEKVPVKKIQFHQFIWNYPRQISKDRIFKVEIFSNEYRFKGLSPLSYFVYRFEGEKKDSLMYNLGNQFHYIDDLSISVEKSLKYGNKIVITLKVTKDGFRCVNYFLRVIYGILYSVKLNTQTVDTYNDLRAIYEKKFLFMTIDKYSSYLNEITFNMLNITNDNNNLNDILYMNYNLEPYDEDTLSSFIEYLSIEHSMFLYKTKQTITNSFDVIKLLNSRDAKRMGSTEALITNLGLSYVSAEVKSEYMNYAIQMFANNDDRFQGKVKNKYLTTISSINEHQEEGDITQGMNTKMIKFWYRKDTMYKVPRLHSYFRFVFPDIRTNDDEKYEYMMIYANVIAREILMRFDEAKMSGNEIVANIDESGLNIKVSGYKDVYMKIINDLFSYIFESSGSIDTWIDNEYDYLTKRYRTREEKALNYLGDVLKPMVNPKDSIEQSKRYDNLSEYFRYNARNMYIESLLYGDVDESIVQEMKSLLSRLDNKGEEIENKYNKTIEEVLDMLSENAEISNNTIHVFKIKENFDGDALNFFISFYQIGKRTTRLDILSSLLCELFNDDDDAISLEIAYKDDIIYLRSIMKSYAVTPLSLCVQLEEKIESFIKNINTIEKEDFESSFNYVKDDYLYGDIRLRHKAIKYWYEIYERTFMFNRHDLIKEELNKINKEELLSEMKKFANDVLVDNVKKIEFMLFNADYAGDIELSCQRKVRAVVKPYYRIQYINS